MTTPGPTIFERNPFSRRRFMQYGAVGTGIVAVSPYLTKLRAFAAPPVGAHQGILVTINLAGGNDGLNMVIPYSDPHYPVLRSSLRVTNSLPIGSGLGLHPALPKLKARFDQGKVAVVPRCRLQPRRPQSLHVRRHLDARLGWCEPGDVGVGRALSRPAPERRPRVAVRRLAARLGRRTPAGRCRPPVVASAEHRRRVRHRPLGPVERTHVRRARELRCRRLGARPARRPVRRDRGRPDSADPTHPARVRVRRPTEQSATAARARRAPHQREPRHPRDRHRARRLRHPLRRTRLARNAHGSARRRHRRVLRDALADLAPERRR